MSKPSFIVCTIEHGISSGITSQRILIDSVLGLAVGVDVRRSFNRAIYREEYQDKMKNWDVYSQEIGESE